MVGFLIGLLLPALGFFIVYLAWHGSGQSFGDFASSVANQKGLMSKVLTLSLLPNLVPFLYFNFKRLDYAMNGVVIATVLYALFIFFVKVVW